MKFIILIAIIAAAFADDKVIGGSEMNKGERPSLVNLRRFGGQFCGGTIINNRYILSAAHCEVSASSVTVHLGDHSLSYEEVGEQQIKASKMIPHAGYNSNTLENDIMMIELSSTITYTSNIKAATRPSRALSTGDICVVCGWGNTATSGSDYPDKPQCVGNLKVIDRDECNGRFAYNGAIKDGMTCIGDMNGGIDSCQGDSGGPIYKGDVLVGVVSWGYGCADKNNPGVYSDVWFYRTWINGNS